MATRGWQDVTMADVTSRELRQALKPKRSKYGATKITIGELTFDSKKEAARFIELRALEKAGQIDSLLRQPVFLLVVKDVLLGSYTADFEYYEDERRIIEDVKSVATRKKELYRWKKKHVEAQYGVQIREV